MDDGCGQKAWASVPVIITYWRASNPEDAVLMMGEIRRLLLKMDISQDLFLATLVLEQWAHEGLV